MTETSHESLARCFFYFDRWISAVAYGNGNINDTYRIDFEQKGLCRTFLLQRLNHLVFKDPEAVMRNIQAVCEHLARQAYPYRTAAPVAALDGQFLQADEAGNWWRVFPFFEPSYAPEGLVGPDIAYQAARAYGAFARALRHFPPEKLTATIPGFHDTDQRWAFFLKILEEDPLGRAQETQPEIADIFSAKPVFDKISDLKRNGHLPLRVTHNDTKAGNVLFDANTHKALAVIDLDTVMPGTILSDFGDMVRTFAADRQEGETGAVSLRHGILDALQRGFLEETGGFLTEPEKQHLLLGAAWITGEQALRFLTDWLSGDVYYKIHYPTHNLVRTRNQLALLSEIMKL